MKKVLAIGFIYISLCCFISICWGDWHGTVYRNGNPVGQCSVKVEPPGGLVITTAQGGYTLGTVNGMQEGKYYVRIKAWKNIDGKTWLGYNYVQDTFHVFQSKWGLDIHLQNNDD